MTTSRTFRNSLNSSESFFLSSDTSLTILRISSSELGKKCSRGKMLIKFAKKWGSCATVQSCFVTKRRKCVIFLPVGLFPMTRNVFEASSRVKTPSWLFQIIKVNSWETQLPWCAWVELFYQNSLKTVCQFRIIKSFTLSVSKRVKISLQSATTSSLSAHWGSSTSNRTSSSNWNIIITLGLVIDCGETIILVTLTWLRNVTFATRNKLVFFKRRQNYTNICMTFFGSQVKDISPVHLHFCPLTFLHTWQWYSYVIHCNCCQIDRSCYLHWDYHSLPCLTSDVCH